MEGSTTKGLYSIIIDDFIKKISVSTDILLVDATSNENFIKCVSEFLSNTINLLVSDKEMANILQYELLIPNSLVKRHINSQYELFYNYLLRAQNKGFMNNSVDARFLAHTILGHVLHFLRGDFTYYDFNSFNESSSKERVWIENTIKLFFREPVN